MNIYIVSLIGLLFGIIVFLNLHFSRKKQSYIVLIIGFAVLINLALVEIPINVIVYTINQYTGLYLFGFNLFGIVTLINAMRFKTGGLFNKIMLVIGIIIITICGYYLLSAVHNELLTRPDFGSTKRNVVLKDWHLTNILYYGEMVLFLLSYFISEFFIIFLPLIQKTFKPSSKSSILRPIGHYSYKYFIYPVSHFLYNKIISPVNKFISPSYKYVKKICYYVFVLFFYRMIIDKIFN